MSTITVLKEYLVGDGGYLLNDDNNGKTVMLSGTWGSGKTHFWLQDIMPQLAHREQKNIYISLYGKESIGELKFEVLRKAYNLEVKEDFISKSASMLSSIAPSLGEKSLVAGFDKLNKEAKDKKSEEILKSGSIICLDDFERKSKKINLNDLFGYISQLAIDYDCKVVIILNSDVFEGDEANVFKTVKEKTVNKFFYFEPTIEELFKSIFYIKTYENKYKYKCLRKFKKEILSAIQDSGELNARIYIQVLDNCLEWIKIGHDSNSIRVITLVTINFVLNDIVLSYKLNSSKPVAKTFDKSIRFMSIIADSILPKFSKITLDLSNEDFIAQTLRDKHFSFKYTYTYSELKKFSDEIVRVMSRMDIVLREQNNTLLSIEDTFKIIERYILSTVATDKGSLLDESIRLEFQENKRELFSIWKYGYRLYSLDKINKETYNVLIDFVKSGVLLSTIPSSENTKDKHEKMILI